MNKLDEALILFGLDENVNELVLKERRNELLKKFHPDNAEENKTYFNDNMAMINSAYDEILQFIIYKDTKQNEQNDLEEQNIENEQDEQNVENEQEEQSEENEENNFSFVQQQKVVWHKEKNTYKKSIKTTKNNKKLKDKIIILFFIGIISILIFFFIFLLKK